MDLDFFILCLVVCIGRVIDVSLGTTRTVFTVRGKPYIASIIAFVEVTLWFLIVREALNCETRGMETYLIAISYALGYSLGTLLGGLVTSKVIRSKINVQLIATNKDDDLIKALGEAGFGATILLATGATTKEERYMILIETDNKKLKLLKSLINEHDPDAFITISDVKSTHNGYFGNRR